MTVAESMEFKKFDFSSSKNKGKVGAGINLEGETHYEEWQGEEGQRPLDVLPL